MVIKIAVYTIITAVLSGCANTPDNADKLAFECKRVDNYPSSCREQCIDNDPFSSADEALRCQRTCDVVQQNICSPK